MSSPRQNAVPRRNGFDINSVAMLCLYLNIHEYGFQIDQCDGDQKDMGHMIMENPYVKAG
jgi:hypothetical protein